MGKRILPHLIRAMKTNPNPCVRANCLSFLDHLDVPPDDEFISVVTTALNDPVPRVRRTAVHTLGCPRCKTVPAALTPGHVSLLVRMSVADENAKVRGAAESMVRMLAGQRYGAAVKDALRQFAETGGEDIRPRAQALLAKIDHADAPE
jgi:HEAT repeat protein